MVQFGIHLFKIYELLFIYGPNSRKFYEWLLHHFVAVILILFSLLSNQITAGIVILIIHDASDIFSSLGRGYMETKFTNTIGLIAVDQTDTNSVNNTSSVPRSRAALSSAA